MIARAICWNPGCWLDDGHTPPCVMGAPVPGWDGAHPPPAPPLPGPCGCDESKALRLELTALRARLARAEGGV